MNSAIAESSLKEYLVISSCSREDNEFGGTPAATVVYIFKSMSPDDIAKSIASRYLLAAIP
jgi:hypothetical protein